MVMVTRFDLHTKSIWDVKLVLDFLCSNGCVSLPEDMIMRRSADVTACWYVGMHMKNKKQTKSKQQQSKQ